MINIEEIRTITEYHYKAAKKCVIEKRAVCESYAAISDVVPGYKADFIDYGAFLSDNFAVLFIDIRNSTKRAKIIGPVDTFLTMHAFMPAMIEVIKYYKGNVIDLMGDGIMAFFGGTHSDLCKKIAVQNAGLCGQDMLLVREKFVNNILKKDGIKYEIDCGVGVDYGDVIVTKIGVRDAYDVKAFGNCINMASKYSKGYNVVKVSKRVKNQWSSSKNGNMRFIGSDEEGYILEKNLC